MDDIFFAAANARAFIADHPEHAEHVRIEPTKVLMNREAIDAFREWSRAKHPETAHDVEWEYQRLVRRSNDGA